MSAPFMNPSDQPALPHSGPQSLSPASIAELREENQTLRILFEFTLVALILFSLSITLFMFKQMRMVRTQLTEQRPFVSRLITDYQKNSEPLIRKFTGAMERFAVTNRDFQPILEKYRPVLRAYLTSPVPQPPSATAPASTQAPTP